MRVAGQPNARSCSRTSRSQFALGTLMRTRSRAAISRTIAASTAGTVCQRPGNETPSGRGHESHTALWRSHSAGKA